MSRQKSGRPAAKGGGLRVGGTVRNAFGEGSPPKNLPFPTGNLTAAEILAYLPHWLKSIDVIDRFVTNGGKSVQIAEMINGFRELPGGRQFAPNSVLKIMQAPMREYYNNDWTLKGHHRWHEDRDWDECSLGVSTFRVPAITNPQKRTYATKKPQVSDRVREISFRDLARYVKNHPSGHDALDLTRCVKWCMERPEKDYLFPSEYGTVLALAGGPAEITHLHLDKEAFARHSRYGRAPLEASRHKTHLLAPTSSLPTTTQPPTTIQPTRTSERMPPKDSSTRKGGHEDQDKSSVKEYPSETGFASDALTPVRRSGRTARVNYAESDMDSFDEPATPLKKVATNQRTSSTRISEQGNQSKGKQRADPDQDCDCESDDEAYGFAPSDYNPETGRFDKTHEQKEAEYRSWSQKHALTQGLYTINPHLPDQKPTLGNLKEDPPPASPTLLAAAKNFGSRVPVYLKPPVLDPLRSVVDEKSIWSHAADGCKTKAEMWESALSSTREFTPGFIVVFRYHSVWQSVTARTY